jgi:hypothetical protein
MDVLIGACGILHSDHLSYLRFFVWYSFSSFLRFFALDLRLPFTRYGCSSCYVLCVVMDPTPRKSTLFIQAHSSCLMYPGALCELSSHATCAFWSCEWIADRGRTVLCGLGASYLSAFACGACRVADGPRMPVGGSGSEMRRISLWGHDEGDKFGLADLCHVTQRAALRVFA